jgi:hypothetical protein
MSLVLDTGALLAAERCHRDTVALLKLELLARRIPLTHAGVVGQAWRGGAGRQARLARLLPALEIVPIDEALGRRAGVLLGLSRKSDVIDAAVVLLASDGDVVLTSGPRDLKALADAAGIQVDLVPV